MPLYGGYALDYHLGDTSQGTPFRKDMVPPLWGMHFYASRDYMHLGAIYLFSPSCPGDIAFGLPFKGIFLKASLFRGDMALLQLSMHFYVSWDYMHLKAISPQGTWIPFRGPLFCFF